MNAHTVERLVTDVASSDVIVVGSGVAGLSAR